MSETAHGNMAWSAHNLKRLQTVNYGNEDANRNDCPMQVRSNNMSCFELPSIS